MFIYICTGVWFFCRVVDDAITDSLLSTSFFFPFCDRIFFFFLFFLAVRILKLRVSSNNGKQMSRESVA